MYCGKRGWSTKAEARRAARQSMRSIRQSGTAKPGTSNGRLFAYHCPRCFEWHLTSSKQRIKEHA